MTKNNKKAKITFAHINDTHSNFEPSSISLNLPEHVLDTESSVYASCGGFSRISSAVSELKAEAYLNQREFMFLHAGDCFQGTLYFSLYKGMANAVLLNAIGVEAMALGNHELDMGNDCVADFLDHTHFPLLAGNWDLSQEVQTKSNPLRDKANVYGYDNSTATAKYIVKDVHGEPVAIFGVAIENMAGIANPDPDTHFMNVETVARNTVQYLHKQGINKIVVLSHLGYDHDIELAQAVDGIGVIIGGHTHTMQGDFTNVGYGKTDQYAHTVNNTCVVQAGCNALAVGHITLEFAEDGTIEQAFGANQLLLGRQFTVDASRTEHLESDDHEIVRHFLSQQDNIRFVVKDPIIENILNEHYRPAVRALQTEEIAVINEPLRHIRIPDQRGPSQIAPWVVESFVWKARELGHNVDFGIHNAGGVRCSLNPGIITPADIAGKLLPFAIGIMIYSVKGKRIRQALEGAIDNAISNGVDGTGDGSFPYVADLRYTYRCCAVKGTRIELLEHLQDGKWIPVEDDKVYSSVSSGYTATGKEGYAPLLDYVKEPMPLNVTMADAFEAYAKQKKYFDVPVDNNTVYIPCTGNQDVA
ncbi:MULTISPECIES: bifunctional UDP-sugar hydrolase/5'-nucleotidase [unclassified Photobacterium]|uniref:bifunctional metallophosphatase/5'-nucleotidase n=1 Tax=unclassified Photobacterium TaxID=2628852 RepID=UPI000D15C150|nr:MULTISPECIES: bifunctional metallophosphatase/5'-nucleotidase [unclassified Photobacterium]PSV27038.1 bifunctional metallophosphatase/5'-nucleotidase [Photobacterium sp. GB-56]PSV37330.1 bifunctional metallophosphatase/5'-nucleotidase [Photobacterium sp. GB-210]PSV54266.1 bifunctional metallophosphatase/5'-nucleotidase [Photobacterium sp. GB-1]PSV56558.1 bifunctional metallophosphatase/5'-nucleotidase [Photobacterium sp. GB-3]